MLVGTLAAPPQQQRPETRGASAFRSDTSTQARAQRAHRGTILYLSRWLSLVRSLAVSLFSLSLSLSLSLSDRWGPTTADQQPASSCTHVTPCSRTRVPGECDMRMRVAPCVDRDGGSLRGGRAVPTRARACRTAAACAWGNRPVGLAWGTCCREARRTGPARVSDASAFARACYSQVHVRVYALCAQ